MRIKELEAQFSDVQADAAKLNEAEAKICGLGAHLESSGGNLNYFVTTLEQARIDEALGPGQVSNISEIQYPVAAL